MVGAIGRDLAHAVRSLVKARAFTLVCVMSLGVGIGTVMAIIIVMRQLTAAASRGEDRWSRRARRQATRTLTGAGWRRNPRTVVLSGLRGSARREHRCGDHRMGAARRRAAPAGRTVCDPRRRNVRVAQLLHDRRHCARTGRRFERSNRTAQPERRPSSSGIACGRTGSAPIPRSSASRSRSMVFRISWSGSHRAGSPATLAEWNPPTRNCGFHSISTRGSRLTLTLDPTVMSTGCA